MSISLNYNFSYTNKEEKDQTGATPLLKSVEFGSVDCTMLLLERGADMSAVNKKDENVLHIAARKNHTETMKVNAHYTQGSQ